MMLPKATGFVIVPFDLWQVSLLSFWRHARRASSISAVAKGSNRAVAARAGQPS